MNAYAPAKGIPRKPMRLQIRKRKVIKRKYRAPHEVA